MLRPSERWQWTYCQNKDRLLLDISDELQFCSPFKASQLLMLPQCQALSMAEAEAFWVIDESLQQLELSDAVRLELCLSALSAAFLQQLAHKSWYFQPAQPTEITQFDVVMLRGMSSQYALVLATDGDCATCMLLDSVDTLAGKTLPRLHVIRLLSNRISSLQKSTSLRYSA